jgi:regulator of protease activity HflC (stomatin/prohibitin superfamily)
MEHDQRRKLILIPLGLVAFLIIFRSLIPMILLLGGVYVLRRRAEGRRGVPPFIQKYISDMKNIFRRSSRGQSTYGSGSFYTKKIPILLGGFLIFIFVSSGLTVVGAGNVGIQTLFGKVYDRELSSGLHIKNPLVRVIEMDTRIREYTMSITQGEGKRSGDDSIASLTKEGLKVDLDITVLYRLNENQASDVYRDVGLHYEETIIRPQIRSAIREVVARYTAKEIYSEKRDVATEEILERLDLAFSARGVEVEDVLLRNVELPVDLARSIQEKLQAEQEAERYDFILEKEKKEAERKRLEAEGQRDAQRIIDQSLTPRYLEYLYISSLKDRAGTIYVPTNPNNGTPMFRGI